MSFEKWFEEKLEDNSRSTLYERDLENYSKILRDFDKNSDEYKDAYLKMYKWIGNAYNDGIIDGIFKATWRPGQI